jgi:hypothetical protein
MAVDGTYNIVIDTPMGKQEAKLTLKAAGNKLSGTMEISFGKSDFTGGTVKGNDISFNMDISTPMGQLNLEYTGKVTGSDISGQVKAGDFGSSPFQGKKA